jgi:hypothetical protein
VKGDRVAEMSQEELHDALYAAIRKELDDSLSFIGRSRALPRWQRRPQVGPAVRDYLADQAAWKAISVLGDRG